MWKGKWIINSFKKHKSFGAVSNPKDSVESTNSFSMDSLTMTRQTSASAAVVPLPGQIFSENSIKGHWESAQTVTLSVLELMGFETKQSTVCSTAKSAARSTVNSTVDATANTKAKIPHMPVRSQCSEVTRHSRIGKRPVKKVPSPLRRFMGQFVSPRFLVGATMFIACALVIGKVSHVRNLYTDRVSAVEGLNSSSASGSGIEKKSENKPVTMPTEISRPLYIKRSPAVIPAVKKLRRSPVSKKSRP